MLDRMKTLLFLVGAAAAWAQAADPVVLTVGTEKITKSMFEQIIGTLTEQQRAQLESPEARRSLAEQIAELKIMAQEGRARHLDASPAMQAKLVLQAEQVLANALYQDLVAAKPDDAALHAYYDEHKNDSVEAKGRHILIRFAGSRVPLREGQKDLSDAEALAKAKEIRVKLVAGGNFEEIAKVESDDTGSGANGGDLGSFGPGQMVEEFDKAAFAIPVGQISEPVRTDFGYHLIKIDSRGAKSFEEMRPEIEQKVRPEMGQKAIDALKAKATVKYDDGYFGIPAPKN